MKCILNARGVKSESLEGPLAAYITSFSESVSDEGYTIDSVKKQTRIVAFFSRWLKQSRVQLHDVSTEHAIRFLRYRARKRRPYLGDPAASVHGVQYFLNQHRKTASETCPSLKHKRVTVHRLRHTMAMDLLQAGVDRSVIALWLGHDSVETTQIYLEATLAMKEKALAKILLPHGKPGRYQPEDHLLSFLNNL